MKSMKESNTKWGANADRAISIICENTKVIYGIFGIIDASGYFPPCNFLNEFLLQGSDPCDQDCRMGTWYPFVLTETEFEIVKQWWMKSHQGVAISELNCECWDDWVQIILNR